MPSYTNWNGSYLAYYLGSSSCCLQINLQVSMVWYKNVFLPHVGQLTSKWWCFRDNGFFSMVSSILWLWQIQCRILPWFPCGLSSSQAVKRGKQHRDSYVGGLYASGLERVYITFKPIPLAKANHKTMPNSKKNWKCIHAVARSRKVVWHL